MAKAKRYNWKQIKALLEGEGWESARGGKHSTKMLKEGCRPITLPHHKNQTYDISFSKSILKQAGIDDD